MEKIKLDDPVISYISLGAEYWGDCTQDEAELYAENLAALVSERFDRVTVKIVYVLPPYAECPTESEDVVYEWIEKNWKKAIEVAQ